MPPFAQPVVSVNTTFVLGCDLLVVVEAWAVLDHILVRPDLDQPTPIVHPDEFDGDKGGPGAQEARFHPDVLWVVVLVDEQVVHLAYLLVVCVVDRVPREAVFQFGEPVATLFGQSAHLLGDA